MWNPEEHKRKMKVPVNKFLTYLKSKDILFWFDDTFNDEQLDNVVFMKDEKILKMSHHSFYRYSGIACTYKEGKNDNDIVPVDVTDERWLFEFIKPIVDRFYNLK